MFGFFKTLLGMGFEPPTVSHSIFPLYIIDLKSGVYYYFEAPLVYVDREKGREVSIAKSVVEDILEEPEAFKESKLYAISEQCVWADGSLVAAAAADTDGAEVAPQEAGDFAPREFAL